MTRVLIPIVGPVVGGANLVNSRGEGTAIVSVQGVAQGREGRQSGRRPADKFVERREQLARSALTTLAELGYARTSLREIAQNSEFSHGVVHYYFDDKLDLIIACVRLYTAECTR